MTRVLVLGANGYLGSHLARNMVGAGHDVAGLVRNADAAARLEATGARSITGDLTNRDVLVPELSAADAIFYAAQLDLAGEYETVAWMLERIAGTGKAFVFTSGTGVLSQRTDGDWSEDSFAEEDIFVPSKYIGARKNTEDMVRAAAATGIRAFVVRPPLLWGNGGCQAVANFYHSAVKTGAVCYIGRGLNLYSNVHVEDLCELYRLILEKGVSGRLYHAVSGEANFRALAEGVAKTLDVPTRSVSLGEAMEIWDKFTALIALATCSRSRSPLARRELGWAPRADRLDIMEEARHPGFAARFMARNRPFEKAT